MTDERGYATVELPACFGALNRDFRYQFTVIGEFAQAIVAEKMGDNCFVIRTDKPGVEVSWQVTGVRQDAYARDYPMHVEVSKPPLVSPRLPTRTPTPQPGPSGQRTAARVQ